MLDNLYENIGGKIKNLAKWIFIIEAIGAIITGLVLLFTDEDLILYGLLTLVGGPIVAYVSSWILYAFGELVEKTADNENNTRQILKKINKNPASYITEESEGKVKSIIASEPTISKASETSNEKKENWTDTTIFSTTEKGTIICSQCNFEQPGNRTCCWHCGAKFENE